MHNRPAVSSPHPVGRSSDAFDENESPTAKRDVLSDVDIANAANRTQKLNPRELLGDAAFERLARGPSASGTRPLVTTDEISASSEQKDLLDGDRPTVAAEPVSDVP